MVLGTSMAAVFGVEELTGPGLNINAQTFRSIEVFSVDGRALRRSPWSRPAVLAVVGRALSACGCACSDAGTGWSRQLPRFFSYYNVVFLGRALLHTFACRRWAAASGWSLGFGWRWCGSARGLATAPLAGGRGGFIELFRRIPFLVTLMLVFYATRSPGSTRRCSPSPA